MVNFWSTWSTFGQLGKLFCPHPWFNFLQLGKLAQPQISHLSCIKDSISSFCPLSSCPNLTFNSLSDLNMSHHRQRKIWAKRKKVWYIRCTCSYPSVNFLQFCKADLNEPHKKMWGSKLLNFWDICQASFCVQQLVHWKWNDWINRLHVAMERTQCNDCTLYNDCIAWVGADCAYGCYAMVCYVMCLKYQWPWICIL